MHRLRGAPVFGIVAMLGVAAVLAGCGSSGSGGVSAAAYVKSVCSAAKPFTKDVLAGERRLLATLRANRNPSDDKKALEGWVSAGAADSDKALTKLKAAGNPGVSNGKAVHAAVVGAFTQMKGAFSQATTQASALPTSSPAAFRPATGRVLVQMGASLKAGGMKFNDQISNNPSLETAARSDPACTLS